MKPQKPVYRNGLGVGAFPGEGPQPGLGGGLSPPKPGYMSWNGLQLPPGLGGGLKPQKPGYGNGNGLGAQPGEGAGNRGKWGDIAGRWRARWAIAGTTSGG
ncbi:DNA-binding protein Rfx5-like [Phocoena sinus]|uniref:DNA-binding protein Rfx5-like n=1 Tax=Phocoena sinus TaxID=42100 RepID=UPI0013C42542|nr:DNA-binding protein Rfx5-like [Phocoena sinus]